MSSRSIKEKLQPSLLDRLTDDRPDQKNESRDQRSITTSQLKACVIRDLQILLNTVHFEADTNLSNFDHVKTSTLNYGSPGLTGFTLSTMDLFQLERLLRETIVQFEPRILKDTLQVEISRTDDEMSNRSLAFIIKGSVWANPMPLALMLKTQVDLETGDTNISESN